MHTLCPPKMDVQVVVSADICLVAGLLWAESVLISRDSDWKVHCEADRSIKAAILVCLHRDDGRT